ncbi:MAG: hypothetical protein WC341_16695, partial [Bacteroidales bacterium]
VQATNYLEASTYYISKGLTFDVGEFEKILGHSMGPAHILKTRPFDINNNLEDLSSTKLGAFVAKKILKVGMDSVKDADVLYQKMVEKSILETPLRSSVIWSGGMIGMNQMKAIIELCNRRFFKAIGYLLRRN